MEMNILKTIDFDIGLPLSYSFLRRYARVKQNKSFFIFINVLIYLVFHVLGKQS